MPRRFVLLCACFALFVALKPQAARADVIDFNPNNDQVPNILTQEELQKYTRIRQISRPSVSSDLSPDGRYVLVGLSNGLNVLDTSLKATTRLTLPTSTNFSGAPTWLTNEVLFGVSRNSVTGIYGKMVVTASVPAAAVSPLALPAIAGKIINPYPAAGYFELPGRGRFILGYTTTRAGTPPLVLERESYEPDDMERPATMAPQRQDILLQTGEKLLLVGLDGQDPITIAELPVGENVGMILGSFSMRPGTATASYVTGVNPPWAGKVVGGRANRGGGMPLGYWNVQESLGLVAEGNNTYITRRNLHLVDVASGQEVLVANSAHLGGRFEDTFWTADGSHLVVTTAKPSLLAGRQHPIYEYEAATALRLFLPDGTFVREWQDPKFDTLGTFFVPTTGTELRVDVPQDLYHHLYTIDLVNKIAPRPIYAGSEYLFSYRVGGGKFVGVLGDAAHPGELYLADAANVEGTKTALTSYNLDVMAAANIKVAQVPYTTSSGHKVVGAYIYPGDWTFPPEKPQPVVVWQQGGPGGQMINTWGTSVESPYTLLPAFGIPVFMVNGAGRLSNGSKFYSDMADGANYGQRDILDVKEGVDELIELEIADPKAIGVTGCSYGGYFTLQSLVEFPEFYRAGNAQCSLNDLMWEFNLGWSPFLGYLMGRAPSGDPDEYLKDSPTFRAYQIKAPLLLFHGTSDFLPFEHLTNIHDQVEMNGVPTRFFRPIGYGHGIGGIQGDTGGAKGQRYAAQLQIQWFRTYLFAKPSVHRWMRMFPDLGLLPLPTVPGEVR